MCLVNVVSNTYLLKLLINLRKDVNNMDQTRQIWIYTVCRRGLQNISAERQEKTTFVVIGALNAILKQSLRLEK